MEVDILAEHGYREALVGLSLSYNSYPNHRVAKTLAFRQGGHNKFLESMIVWLEIDAPRYWWQQFDTYRVGTTKQSQSTMHTLMRKELSRLDFEGEIDNSILSLLNKFRENKEFEKLKAHLPESFLQTRVVCTNYKVLQNMVIQRSTHKLGEWAYFIAELKDQLEFPEFIFREEGKGE